MQLKHLRSLLFVPATSPHLLAKAGQRGADALIVDLEDSVPIDRKVDARVMAAAAIEQLAGQVPVLVRVNSEPDLLRADVDALPLAKVQGVLLPKVESAAQVVGLMEILGRRGGASMPVAALIETPLGVLRAEAIATAHPALCALGFGAEDHAAQLLVEPIPESLLWAAQAVINCARAFDLAAWGLPGSVAEIDDMQAFGQLVRLARGIGFSGTVCIHPRQVAVANSGFAPTPQQLDWARKVVAADEQARGQGRGAVTLDGRMIDRPIVARARHWLERA
ncbi:HpcH/HpaI aldolase/citrate lyase family protein [Piscinibacter sakaiensis]|uniref:HpcH/HpaI aldolase/citrate lyase family protein n=1 Tax=Piscinibacter sakaiensis TaxID=1547922 RepID=UPI003AAE70A2